MEKTDYFLHNRIKLLAYGLNAVEFWVFFKTNTAAQSVILLDSGKSKPNGSASRSPARSPSELVMPTGRDFSARPVDPLARPDPRSWFFSNFGPARPVQISMLTFLLLKIYPIFVTKLSVGFFENASICESGGAKYWILFTFLFNIIHFGNHFAVTCWTISARPGPRAGRAEMSRPGPARRHH